MELLDIVTEEGLPTGETAERQYVHANGLRHRTAHIWVIREVDGRPQVILQKRSMEKDSYPGCLDTSSAGHIQAGDEPLDSALREFEEELGIHAMKDELTFMGNFRIISENIFHGQPFRDNEVVFAYAYEKPVDISDFTVQKEELESVAWFDFYETVAECEAHNPAYCVPAGGLATVQHYIENKK